MRNACEQIHNTPAILLRHIQVGLENLILQISRSRRGFVFNTRDVGQLRKIIILWSFTELRNAYQASQEPSRWQN